MERMPRVDAASAASQQAVSQLRSRVNVERMVGSSGVKRQLAQAQLHAPPPPPSCRLGRGSSGEAQTWRLRWRVRVCWM